MAGGARPGAGRPKGSRKKASAKQVDEITADGRQTPLEYLASIYQNDENSTHQRIDAAKAAAPYVHAKLSSVDVHASLSEMTHEEWLATLK